MNTQRHLSAQVSVWGGDRGNGWLQCSKKFPPQQRDEGFLLLASKVGHQWMGKLCSSPITHCYLKMQSKHIYSEALAWTEKRASARGCGEMKRSKESEAWFVPHCHYPHFLATVSKLPCNEGKFQGFLPGTHKILQWLPEIPRTFTLGSK